MTRTPGRRVVPKRPTMYSNPQPERKLCATELPNTSRVGPAVKSKHPRTAKFREEQTTFAVNAAKAVEFAQSVLRKKGYPALDTSSVREAVEGHRPTKGGQHRVTFFDHRNVPHRAALVEKITDSKDRVFMLMQILRQGQRPNSIRNPLAAAPFERIVTPFDPNPKFCRP